MAITRFVLLMLLMLRRLMSSYQTRLTLKSVQAGVNIVSDSDFLASLLPVSSEHNEKYKLFKQLYTKKSKRVLENLVILESHRTVIDAIRYGMKPRTIFLTPAALEAPLGNDLKAEISKYQYVKDVTCASSESLVEKLSDVESCQGVIGIFPIERFTSLPSSISIAVACDKVSDPGNLGTVMRTAFGLGIEALISIGTTDPWSPKCIRSSMGTAIQLPIIETTWKDMRSIIHERGFKMYLAVLDETAVPYYTVDYSKPCIIVIGSEALGVSEEALTLPNVQKIYIPMGKHLGMSLNAAVAGSIIMAEAVKQRSMIRNIAVS